MTRLTHTPQKPALCFAIKEKRKIHFVYNGKLRIGNPQCYGINKKGNEALRVHLLEGGSRPEQMFLCDGIDFIVTGDRFEKPGPNYHKGDKDMIYIFCELAGMNVDRSLCDFVTHPISLFFNWSPISNCLRIKSTNCRLFLQFPVTYLL